MAIHLVPVLAGGCAHTHRSEPPPHKDNSVLQETLPGADGNALPSEVVETRFQRGVTTRIAIEERFGPPDVIAITDDHVMCVYRKVSGEAACAAFGANDAVDGVPTPGPCEELGRAGSSDIAVLLIVYVDENEVLIDHKIRRGVP